MKKSVGKSMKYYSLRLKMVRIKTKKECSSTSFLKDWMQNEMKKNGLELKPNGVQN